MPCWPFLCGGFSQPYSVYFWSEGFSHNHILWYKMGSSRNGVWFSNHSSFCAISIERCRHFCPSETTKKEQITPEVINSLVQRKKWKLNAMQIYDFCLYVCHVFHYELLSIKRKHLRIKNRIWKFWYQNQKPMNMEKEISSTFHEFYQSVVQ